MGIGLHKITILPRPLEYFIDRHIENKKIRLADKLIILFGLIGVLLIIKPASANILNFFGYNKNMRLTTSMILSGYYSRRTLNLCFSDAIIDSVAGNGLITLISDAMSGIAILIAFIHSIAKMIEYAETGMITSERLASILIQYALPILLILNISMVTDAVKAFGQFALDKGNSAISTYLNGGSLDDSLFSPQDYIEDYTETENDDTGSLNGMFSDLSGIQQAMNGYMGSTGSLALAHIYEVFNKDALDDSGSKFTLSLTTRIKNAIKSAMANVVKLIVCLCVIMMDLMLRVSIMVSCYGVYGRLMLYQAFLPMGIADIGSEGTRSNGMRMIKRFFGVYIEILLFFVINQSFWEIFYTLVMSTSTIVAAIICFISLGSGLRASFKSAKTMSEQIVGV